MTHSRSPQFTLKTLFAATSGCALFFGYLHWTGKHALALAVATAQLVVFVPIPLAFASSVAIDGWRPTLDRWNLRLVITLMALTAAWTLVLAMIYPSALRMIF